MPTSTPRSESEPRLARSPFGFLAPNRPRAGSVKPRRVHTDSDVSSLRSGKGKTPASPFQRSLSLGGNLTPENKRKGISFGRSEASPRRERSRLHGLLKKYYLAIAETSISKKKPAEELKTEANGLANMPDHSYDSGHFRGLPELTLDQVLNLVAINPRAAKVFAYDDRLVMNEINSCQDLICCLKASKYFSPLLEQGGINCFIDNQTDLLSILDLVDTSWCEHLLFKLGKTSLLRETEATYNVVMKLKDSPIIQKKLMQQQHVVSLFENPNNRVSAGEDLLFILRNNLNLGFLLKNPTMADLPPFRKFKEFKQWLADSSEENTNASYLLARIYHLGIRTKESMPLAIKHYLMAYQQQSTKAEKHLKLISSELHALLLDEEKPLDKKAFEQLDALMPEEGQGLFPGKLRSNSLSEFMLATRKTAAKALSEKFSQATSPNHLSRESSSTSARPR